jgi:hypothetical protein
MYPPEMMFDLLVRQCWDKSSQQLFQAFLAANQNVDRWIITSDYCLRDNTRANDCYAFSIVPYEHDLTAKLARIKAALPRDIKRTRYLVQAGVDLLTDTKVFHIVILVPKDRSFDALNATALVLVTHNATS